MTGSRNSAPPVDREQRERARTDHATGFVIEAGAGTGKTTLLVDRIEALVRSGGARLDQVAAVTFTENAATTMKLRLRERLERARADAQASFVERERAAQALEVIERAPISTIHALCAAILQERPLECGVPPGFRVADEAEADLVFASAWEEWLAERLTRGDDLLLEAMDAGIPLEGEGWGERTSMRGLARTLLEQRDLRPLVASTAVDPEAWRAELLSQARRAAELAAQAALGDTLAARLRGLVEYAAQAEKLEGAALIAHLVRLEAIPQTFGHKPKWPSVAALEAARGIAAWTKRARTAWATTLSALLHGRLVTALLEVVSIYAAKKTARGLLDFLDLLLKTRDALRDRESVRYHFRSRFRFVIIDEFQDTDPLQVEIAQLLAGDRPGALVVVGDPKQSIYRFRRAEIALFRSVSQRASRTPGAGVLHLTQNFRSRPAILRFVNRAFASLIQPSDETGQPAYEAIEAPAGLGDEPAVIALRFEASFAEGEDLLRAEAGALASFLAQAAAGGEQVRDAAGGSARGSRAGDVMVLARRLTHVRLLEEALDGAGLRFTVEGGKSFFDRQEVHETLAVLRAIEDPSDRLSLVAALRSSFFGVSDRDIVGYAVSGGPLWTGAVDDSKPGARALRPCLELLERLYRLRTRISVPALLERLYDETRIMAALTGTRRGEGQIANIEKVSALARQASELGVLTLRGFAALLAERVESAREEPDLPATRPGDPHTVRILSIHKAKGLESPIVALYDAADDFRPRTDTVPLWDRGLIAIGFREGCQPPDWDTLVQREQARWWAEARRLLYVACTRARDRLVIPAPPRDARVGSFWKDLVAFLPAASDGDVRVVHAESLTAVRPERPRPDLRLLAQASGGDAMAARWEAERRDRLAAASRRALAPISATRAAARQAPPGLASSVSLGRDFGRLVHRILEWIPLGEPERASSMAEALAPAFGLDAEGARRAGEAARRALELPIMDRARRAERSWRELQVSFCEGAELIEGVVDLVFEEEGELVVVDYKTDHLETEQALVQAAHHAPQLQLYGRGLARATRLKVRERLVIFTSLGRSVPV